MAHPFKGCNASILRISMSSVPWTRSEGLLTRSPLGYRVRLDLLPSVSKRSSKNEGRVSEWSIITGQPFESHFKNSSRKALFSRDWVFHEKQLCFRFRSWRVSAGGRPQ